MNTDITRRKLLAGVAALTTTTLLQAKPESPSKRFRYCLNTSTVRDNGKQRPIVELIDIAAKTGYDAIEPWISELETYTQAGGSLKELRKRISDVGLVVPDAIGFAPWIVNDDLTRQQGIGNGQAFDGNGAANWRDAPCPRRRSVRPNRRMKQSICWPLRIVMVSY